MNWINLKNYYLGRRWQCGYRPVYFLFILESASYRPMNQISAQCIIRWIKRHTNAEESKVCLHPVISEWLIWKEKKKGQIFLPPSIYILNSQFIPLFPVSKSLQECASHSWDVEPQQNSDLPVGRSRGRQQPTHAIYGDGISEKIKLFSLPPVHLSTSYPHSSSSSICLSVISSFGAPARFVRWHLYVSPQLCLWHCLSRYSPLLFLFFSLVFSFPFHFIFIYFFFFALSVFYNSSFELSFLISVVLSFPTPPPVISLIYNFSISSKSRFSWRLSSRNFSLVVYRTRRPFPSLLPVFKQKRYEFHRNVDLKA